MKVNTEVLKGMVSKATSGVGNNKLIPITQLMGIELKDGELSIITTDATNYLYITNQIDTDEDFSVTVYAEQFSKLVSKITSEYITLEVKNGSLEVKGNGTYTVELPLDESGNLIQYPSPIDDVDYTSIHITKVSLSLVKTILESLKGSLAITMEMPVITQYYTGDTILATNRYTVAEINNRFCDTNMLVSSECMELLDNMTDEIIDATIGNDFVIFKGTGCIVYSKNSNDVNDYPVDTLTQLLVSDIPYMCKINKNELVNLLDRMTLFANDVTRQLAPVKLSFGSGALTVYNKSGKSCEDIWYTEDTGKSEDFECWINIALLTAQLKSYSGDIVEIHYGNDKLIKFVDGSITQVIALFVE